VGVRWLAESGTAAAGDGALSGEKWADFISAGSAESLALYSDGYFAGTPAITVNRFAEGRAYYVATEPDENLARCLVSHLFREANIEPLLETPPGVEAARRSGPGKSYVFLLNHNDHAVRLPVPRGWLSVRKEVTPEGELKLPPFGIGVFEV